jgi:hypothetical protein
MPEDKYELALRRHIRMIERRVRKLYVRPRAVFAEEVVAVWVDGKVMEFPGQAWDIEMQLPPGRAVRIQVKCSGERAPFDREIRRAPVWGVLKTPTRNRGGPPDYRHLGEGLKGDVFVFARHTGWSITQGWWFYVLSTRRVRAGIRQHPTLKPNITLDWLQKRGAVECGPGELKRAVVDVARAARPGVWPAH